MERYPLCRIEAFVESITHLQNIADRRTVVLNFISAQGSGKGVKEYLANIDTQKGQKSHEDSADELLSAFRAGFKGLD